MRRILTYLFLWMLTAALLYGGGNKEDVAVLETNYGKIYIQLFYKETPKHAFNFKKLVESGFYDSLTFHRVIPGFVIQGGDPNSKDDDPYNDGKGGPGYLIPAELGKLHRKGAVGAARMGDGVNPKKKSNGSQFYICLKNLPQLDAGGYTVFGRVIDGWDAVKAIAALKRDGRDKPLTPAIIKKAYMVKMKINNKIK